MNNTTDQRLASLREAMRSAGVDAVIIPGTDPHQSETPADHWKLREWLTGFTGSNGTAAVTMHAAGLWTDSRYFLQAEQQLDGTEFTMYRENGDDNTDPDIRQWLAEQLEGDGLIGIDGTVFSAVESARLERFCAENGLMLATDFRVADRIYTDRPPRPDTPVEIYPDTLAGESVESKLQRVREVLEAAEADAMLITALDDIAWLLNIRGNDLPNTPVTVAFCLLSMDGCELFIDKNKVTDPVERTLRGYGVRLRNYDDVERFAERTPISMSVLLDANTVSDTLTNAFPGQKILQASPIAALKAIKNDTEIAGTRLAMERDGAALVRLFRWIEQHAPLADINEVDIADQCISLRSNMENYRDESFPMIAGYNDHGAIVHYQADDNSAATLHANGLLLLDTGAQYLDGTTDITRTIALGTPTDRQRHDYTLVLKGHLALSRAIWPEGLCGVNLDVLARMPLWQEGMTFFHGTGHGVGHYLCCHEGPHSIRTEINPTPLQPGMIVSNEPGLYKAGEYGIRIENLMLVTAAEKTEFGQFLQFETLTLMPYDRNLIDTAMLTTEEVEQINRYHDHVLRRLTPLLNPDEQQWLANKTQPL